MAIAPIGHTYEKIEKGELVDVKGELDVAVGRHG
jgi:hypothetical protein